MAKAKRNHQKGPSNAEILAAKHKKLEPETVSQPEPAQKAPDETKHGVQSVLRGKILINAVLKLETGLHIGASSDFAPIGAVDLPFVRDPMTKEPVIPGSSIKGKLRTLLARSLQPGENGYWLKEISQDPDQVKRLFGIAAEKDAFCSSRLQFSDLRLTEESLTKFQHMSLDTYIGEVKFENTINRLTAMANPRQIERVPAGTEFGLHLIYNVEQMDTLMDDMRTLADGLKLLQMDYLGGSGSRGYGRVSLHDFHVDAFSLQPARREEIESKLEDVKQILEGSKL